MEPGQSWIRELSPALYLQLKRLARRYLQPSHTYQPTELVNETLAHLLAGEARFQNRQHFFATCVRQMRNFLVNHAKAKQCLKRGHAESFTTSDLEAIAGESSNEVSIIDVDDLLTKFERIDAAAAQAMGLCYFAGFTVDEVARIMNVSEATITRKLRFGRAWMRCRLVPQQERRPSEISPSTMDL